LGHGLYRLRSYEKWVAIVAGFKIMTNIRWKKIKQPAWLPMSLAGHLILIFIILIGLSRSQLSEDDYPETSALPAFLKIEQDPAHRQSVEPIKQALTRTLARKTAVKRQQTAAATPQHRSATPTPELLALLHAAIAEQQHYPVSAQEMDQSGRVTLGFKLFPNGSVDQLSITRSSGVTSLDEAALSAIKNATPFQQVDRYLQTAEHYQIDVVFTLK
jgi:TonB family protein